MRQEVIKSINGMQVVTESGAKVPIGNMSFFVGQTVWTEDGYVFGHSNRKQLPIVTTIFENKPEKMMVIWNSLGGTLDVYQVSNNSFLKADSVPCPSSGNAKLFYSKTGRFILATWMGKSITFKDSLQGTQSISLSGNALEFDGRFEGNSFVVEVVLIFDSDEKTYSVVDDSWSDSTEASVVKNVYVDYVQASSSNIVTINDNVAKITNALHATLPTMDIKAGSNLWLNLKNYTSRMLTYKELNEIYEFTQSNIVDSVIASVASRVSGVGTDRTGYTVDLYSINSPQMLIRLQKYIEKYSTILYKKADVLDVFSSKVVAVKSLSTHYFMSYLNETSSSYTDNETNTSGYVGHVNHYFPRQFALCYKDLSPSSERTEPLPCVKIKSVDANISIFPDRSERLTEFYNFADGDKEYGVKSYATYSSRSGFIDLFEGSNSVYERKYATSENEFVWKSGVDANAAAKIFVSGAVRIDDSTANLVENVEYSFAVECGDGVSLEISYDYYPHVKSQIAFLNGKKIYEFFDEEYFGKPMFCVDGNFAYCINRMASAITRINLASLETTDVLTFEEGYQGSINNGNCEIIDVGIEQIRSALKKIGGG